MRRNRVIRKAFIYTLIGAIVAGNITPAYAYTNSVGNVDETGTVTAPSDAESCEVYATLASSFKVTIPKKITLDGGTKKGSYTVDVEGDIGGTDVIKVVPEDSFTLSSTGLADQTALVSQDKTQWSYSEILPDSKTIGKGSISASGITAGSWNGSFWFNINFEEGAGSESQSTLTLSVDDVAIGTGNSVQVNAYLDGEIANDAVTWSSDNKNITVTNGLVETSANAQAGDTATITVTANNTENLSAMANVLSNLGIVTYANADDTLSASFNVTVIDMAYTTSGEDEVITSLDIKVGESKDVEVTIIPASVSGTVSWSTTAPAGLSLISNGNTVTLKVASDMTVGSTYNLVATYGNFSKLLKINIVSDHTHSYASSVTTEATCTTDGEITYACECGDSYTEAIPATGHTFGEWETVTSPNCTEDGSEQRNCEVCGYTETNGLSALGHSWEDDYTVDKAATCAEDGSKSIHCTNCDATKYSTVIPATGHSYGSWVTTKEATCTENGSKQRICATCGNVETEAITKLGHDYNSVVTAPTCTTEGYTTHTCSRCNDSYVDSKVSATGHSYDAGVATIKATCTEDGEMTYTCTGCGVSYTEEISAVGHNYVDGKCTRCNALEAGLYDANGTMLCCWEDSGIDLSINYDYRSSSTNYYQTTPTSGYYVLTNNYPTATKVVIPDSVTSIGDRAFMGCTGLTSITIPDSVMTMGIVVFYGCTGLTNITIGNNITCIGTSTFYNCTSLTSIEIPEGVTSIGDFAFWNCTSLTSITIPDSVTSIGANAFWNCTSLTSITIPDSVTSIGAGAFSSCSSLTNITIPDGVTSIGKDTFNRCTGLTNVTIPDSVITIRPYAFQNCTNLTSATFKTTSGWYVGDYLGAKTTALSSSNLANTSIAATYLKSSHSEEYWTRY